MTQSIWLALALFLYMNAWAIYALAKKRNDIADVAWGPGFVLLALMNAWLVPGTRSYLIALLVFVWGTRLAWHIGSRFFAKPAEDSRYQRMRQVWRGSQSFNSWLRVFMLQGALLLVVAMPIILAEASAPLYWYNYSGLFVWIFGFVFEVIGDRQLRAFLRDRQGERIMKRGLWKYTRHPNYFGEALLWWGIWLIGLGGTWSIVGIIGPIAINILLRYVSGVPLAEASLAEDPEYQAYKAKTPPLIPNFWIR